MEAKSWQKFILESQRCERCESAQLKSVRSGIEVYWKSGRDFEGMLVYHTPTLKCSECGHLHISNSTLGILREQFLSGEREVNFNYERLNEVLMTMEPEEQWVELNYYFSVSAVDCGFQVRSLAIESEEKSNNADMEVMHG